MSCSIGVRSAGWSARSFGTTASATTIGMRATPRRMTDSLAGRSDDKRLDLGRESSRYPLSCRMQDPAGYEASQEVGNDGCRPRTATTWMSEVLASRGTDGQIHLCQAPTNTPNVSSIAV